MDEFGAVLQEDKAHGGYTFCSIASLVILKQPNKTNVEALMQWCSCR